MKKSIGAFPHCAEFILLLVFGCSLSSHTDASTLEDTRHFIQRIGFAEPPNIVIDASRLDRETLIDKFLNNTAEATPVEAPNWATQAAQARPIYTGLSDQEKKRLQKEQRMQEKERLQTLQHWWLVNLIVTDNALAAKMTLFWQNHFTSSHQKVKHAQLLYSQHQLLESYALGNFGELLHRILKDPAMLIYLDNTANRKAAPNENLARELLELFTLGEGHYRESDIKETARALTGYRIDKDKQYVFRENQHDKGEKTILGVTAHHDVDTVVNTILNNPECALLVVNKLWRLFISPNPEQKQVRELADIFRSNDYEIKPLLRAMFESSAFWAAENRGQLTKSPADYIAGTLRVLQVQSINLKSAVRALKTMEQPLFNPPNVKGWTGGEDWINGNTLLSRIAFVRAVLNDPDRIFAVKSMQSRSMQINMVDQKMKSSTMQPKTETAQMTYSADQASWLNGNLAIEKIRSSLLVEGIDRQYTDTASRSNNIDKLFLEPAWHLY